MTQTEPARRPGQRLPTGVAPLLALLLAALAVRVVAAVRHPNIIWADEVFQTVEPAYHLVYGDWLRSWEWVVGMRSWLVPGLLEVPLGLGRLADPGGHLGTLPVTAFMLLLSLIPVAVGFRWGERLQGPGGGLFVGGVAAVWADLLYMAPHPLTDVMASHTLLLALYAAFPLSAAPSPRRLVAAGALLALSVYLRMQLGPAAAVAVAFAGDASWRRWRAQILGGGAVLAVLGVFDWVTLGTPFQSIWLNFWLNIIGGVSSGYGEAPPLFFLLGPYLVWGLPCILIFTQFVFAFRKYPAIAWVVLTIFATQSCIPHKEWRFIFPALGPLILVCALSALDYRPQAERLVGRLGLTAGTTPVIALALAALVSFAAGSTPLYSSLWVGKQGVVEAFDLIRNDPRACGVGLADIDERAERYLKYSWVLGGGSAALPPGLPQYAAYQSNLPQAWRAYNWMVKLDSRPPPDGFHKVLCIVGDIDAATGRRAQTCAYRRDGGCDPSAAGVPAVNWPDYFTDARGQLIPARLTPGFLGLRPHPFGDLLIARSRAR